MKSMNETGLISLLLVTHFVSFSSAVLAQTDPASELAGVWGADESYGPVIRGLLTIVHDGNDWRASIAGFEAPLHADQNELSFALPGGRGEFR
jgi:hypothetical protein